jgi:hypothetical protein
MPSLKTRINSAIGSLKAPFSAGRELVDLLEADHRLFEDLVDRIGETGDRAIATRRKLFTQLRERLVAHEHMEETQLYPALSRFPEAAEIVREGYQEHHVADLMLAELGRMDIASDTWRTKVHVLGESLLHHIQEEERDMVPKARKLLSGPQLDRLAERMGRDRQRMMARGSRPAPRKSAVKAGTKRSRSK